MEYQSLIYHWGRYDRTIKGEIEQDCDAKYESSAASGIWSDPTSNIREKVDFLSVFGCKVDGDTAALNIAEHSASFKTFLQGVSAIDLMTLVHRDSEKIAQLYNLLAKVCGLSPTATSTYLHMHKPDLFVMWNKEVFLDYFPVKMYSKATATSEKYMKFLLRMKSEMQEALFSFSASTYVSEAQVIVELKRHFNNETLPRILDKYNNATRNKKKFEE